MKHNLILVALLIGGGFTAFSQDLDANTVKHMMETQRFSFVAQTVLPAQGRTRDVTPDYDLTITRDSVAAWLPYYGQAYTAPTNPEDGGIKFISTKFEYTLKAKKKKSWDITIRPKDNSDVQQLYLTVFDNGRATLEVISTNRQQISYNGYLKELTPLKKGF